MCIYSIWILEQFPKKHMFHLNMTIYKFSCNTGVFLWWNTVTLKVSAVALYCSLYMYMGQVHNRLLYKAIKEVKYLNIPKTSDFFSRKKSLYFMHAQSTNLKQSRAKNLTFDLLEDNNFNLEFQTKNLNP